MLYLTLRQLEYVVAIARAGSLNAAARHLHVSQPALSVAIGQVEAHLGHPLFERRRGAPVVPSAAGAGFVVEAEALLAGAARLEAGAGARHGPRLRIGCFTDLAPRFFAPALRCLRAADPALAVTSPVADFETLARDLLDGRLDLAITYDLGLDASFERVLLGTVGPHAFVEPSSPLAGRGHLGLADMADRPLILFDEGLSIRHMLDLLRRHGIVARIAHRAASLEVMRSLAANGEGTGISYTVPPGGLSYDGRPVAAIPIEDADAREPVILARACVTRPSRATSAAIGALRALAFDASGAADGPRGAPDPDAPD